MKFGRVAAVFAAVVLGMLGVMAPQASAADAWHWQSQWDSGYLDYNPTNGVHTRPWNGGPYQLWEYKRYSDGTYRFMNVATKLCLDNSEYGVRAFGCNDGAWQRWDMNDWGNGNWELVSMWDHRCLDNSTYGIRTVGCNGLSYQLWK
ncbi:hypothetical protein GCM10022243_31230 [Saccharothrix violaceirubra]|uniref:Ricin B lectin domain-containing protein n=1 Tax=Saccharothrix violaceirubra TaxID=413306 RepID=A0A7W7T538_9PSEU|nr:RICIN domain-containing protein [Saccharothrix violaceirubra]MBB4966748.1 hypothetical protein [Saccharothrix violaceirubra]